MTGRAVLGLALALSLGGCGGPEVVISGDALITDHPVAPRQGPQLLPSLFNHDDESCRRSLAALAALDAEVLLPGHGPVWRGPVREAAEQALHATTAEP